MQFNIGELVVLAQSWRDTGRSDREFDECFCGIYDCEEEFVAENYIPNTWPDLPERVLNHVDMSGLWRDLMTSGEFEAIYIEEGRVGVFACH